MALLYRNRVASFTAVQQALQLTPGNLNSHVARLEAAGYVKPWNALTPTGFQIHLRITPEGLEAYRRYLAELRALLGPEE